MISIEKNFLFIHYPKTGGNSIQKILIEHSEDRIVFSNNQDGKNRFNVVNSKYKTRKHSSLADYKKSLEPSLYGALFKFTTIRNPWDRAISLYFSPHAQRTDWDRNEFKKLIKRTSSLETLIKTDKYIGLPIITRLKKPKLDLNVDYIMRYENLQEDFNKVCTTLGIEPQTLPSINVSSRSHYTTYYDNELIELVAKKFEREITFGNYRFE